MPDLPPPFDNHAAKPAAKTKDKTEEEIRAYTVGPVEPLHHQIEIVEYDSRWPDVFAHHANAIRSVLGRRALRIEHVGSTSVPNLAAKPVIDVLLVVACSARESDYAPDLESAGFELRIREPEWYEHCMFQRPDGSVNLHVLSSGCPEIDRMLIFRDWLRREAADRELYANTKLALANRQWKHVQNYADAKTAVIAEIMERARSGSKSWSEPGAAANGSNGEGAE